MDAPSARALRAFGVDPSAHVARRMTREMVAAADLVLTADTDHRAIVVRAEPLAFRRAFTMREFARLGAALPLPPEEPPLSPPAPNQPPPRLDNAPSPAALRARVQEIAEQRGRAEAAEPGADNIADPFGAGFEVARASMLTVSTAVDGVIKALGVTSVPEPFNVGNSRNESPRA